MKKYLLPLLFFLLCLSPGVLPAQQDPYSGEIRVGFDGYTLTGDMLTLRLDIDLSALDLPKYELLTFSPALRATDTSREHTFPPVIVCGRERDKLIRRSEFFGESFGPDAQQYIVLERKDPRQSIELTLDVPFEKWMRRSYLLLTEQTTGCTMQLLLYANGLDAKTYAGEPYRFPDPYKPVYQVMYITPPVEAVKIQQDTYSARLQFPVNLSTLLPEFGDNARILAEADEIIHRVQNDPLLTLRSVVVKGYASPEGNFASNMKLSTDRAHVFVSYLQGKGALDRSMITAEGFGEDWPGLRDAVAVSDINDKAKVLEAIDGITDINRRKNAIRGLSGGRTYRTMLDKLYPPLRRNEYTISYEVRGFNAQEAKDLIQTRPQLLSLNEMFMAAQLYNPESPEYKAVFEIAARVYPDSPVAQFNVAAMEIENGSFDTAIERLEPIGSPEAWNNLGIAYWHRGAYEKAAEYFRRASAAGLKTALDNQEQYQRWFEDKED